MRDPEAPRIGLQVVTPNGVGVIRARRGGPLTQWLVMDFWWREGQLEPVEPPEPETGISTRCRAGLHHLCGGGFLSHNGPMECACRCGHVDGYPGHRERDRKAATCDNQGAKKTARDGVSLTDPGLTDTLRDQERLMSKSTREPASRPPIGER